MKPDQPKLCECGCGEPAPIAKMTDRRYGARKGEPVRFLPHHHAAMKKSAEHRQRISLSQGGTGETGVTALHRTLLQRHPKSGVCEECGAEGKTHYAFLRHPEPHTENRDDYRELCPLCHKRFDTAARKS